MLKNLAKTQRQRRKSLRSKQDEDDEVQLKTKPLKLAARLKNTFQAGDDAESSSEEEEDEEQYITDRNREFRYWTKDVQDMHSLVLWRRFYVMVRCIVTINEEVDLVTKKIKIFGRQSIGYRRSRKRTCENLLIMPQSMLKIIWDYLILILLIYLITFGIYTMVYAQNGSTTETIGDIIDTISDYIFIFDIFINFFSAYEKEDLQIEMGFKRIAINYLTGFFLIDFVASIPLNEIYYLVYS